MRNKLLEWRLFYYIDRYGCTRSDTVFLLHWLENHKNWSRAPSFGRSVLRHSELIPRTRSTLIGVSGYEDRMFPRVTTLTAASARTARPEKKVLLYNTTWS